MAVAHWWFLRGNINRVVQNCLLFCKHRSYYVRIVLRACNDRGLKWRESFFARIGR